MKHAARALSVLFAVFLCSSLAMAAYCAKCGKKMPTAVKFCPDCGHKVGMPVDEKAIKKEAREVPTYKSIEEANTYFKLAEKERTSAGARLLPFVKNKRYKNALELYLKILHKWPLSDKCEPAAYHAAQIYESYAYRDYPKAIKYYRMVVEINPATTLDARLQIAKLTEEKLLDYQTAEVRYQETIEQARVQSEKEKAAKELKDLREKAEKAQEKLET